MNDKETLEEVAERLTKDFPHYSVRGNMDDSDIKGWFLEALQKGAKWQQERSYSEEDMLEFGEWMKVLPLTISGFVVKTKTKSIVVEKTKDLLQIWFKQFKKK